VRTLLAARRRAVLSATGSIVAIALGGCFSLTGLNRLQPNLYSVDQEIGLGREMAKSLEKELTLIRHHQLAQLVQSVGRRIQEGAGPAEFGLYPFTFKVVDSSEINAFSLPGGPIYVNMGLLEIADTEDEIAGVIAHEMAHVVSRHATEQMTTLQLSQMAILVTLSAIGGAPAAALEGGQLAYVLGLLRYSRAMESEADDLGLEAMRKAGYDPRGMERMMEKLLAERRTEPLLLERLLSSHPLPDERVAEIRSRIARLAPSGSAPPPSDAFVRTKVLFAKD
jgi:predicted Zn-dependent protease